MARLRVASLFAASAGPGIRGSQLQVCAAPYGSSVPTEWWIFLGRLSKLLANQFADGEQVFLERVAASARLARRFAHTGIIVIGQNNDPGGSVGRDDPPGRCDAVHCCHF